MIKRNIANFLTVLNLVSGLFGLYFLLIEQRLDWAVYAMFTGIFFDYIDGFVARITHTSGELGLQLDTLADMVTSGVLPGMMLFQVLRNFVFDHALTAFAFAVLVPVSTAIRLAKFNIDTRQKFGFIGLPAPANALMIASVFWVLFVSPGSRFFAFYGHPVFLILFTLFSALILNAPIPLMAIKFQDFSWQANKDKYIFVLIGIVLLLTAGFAVIPLIILLYILYSLLSQVKKRTGETSA